MPPTRSTRSKPKNAAAPKPAKKPKTVKTNPDQTYRKNDTHIFFHGGVLSNWRLCPIPFKGASALQHAVPHMQKLGVSHPAETALSTRLISIYPFLRGEQWMMAMKAWLFERDACLENNISLSETQLGDLLALLLHPLLSKATHPSLEQVSEYIPREDVEALWETSLCCIMTEKAPMKQKALGRRVRGFDEEVWRRASVPAVMAGCVARAAGDPELRDVYQEAEGRMFVEGSPRDRVWGVGLGWKSTPIEDESNWRGENRLGRCHALAAEIVCGREVHIV